MVRVLIADDDAVMRAALAELIASEGSFTLVGAARDADEAIALAESERPDVALRGRSGSSSLISARPSREISIDSTTMCFAEYVRLVALTLASSPSTGGEALINSRHSCRSIHTSNSSSLAHSLLRCRIVGWLMREAQGNPLR